MPMSTPNGPATMTLVPLDANSDFACQPRSSSAEASYVFRRFQVRIETATSPPTIVAPLGDVVDMGWERACRRLAEAMLARFPSDRILHTETLPESEELDGVAIRLRDGGARFHLTPDPERGCHFFNLPGNRILYRRIGTTRDVPDARLEFQPPGDGTLQTEGSRNCVTRNNAPMLAISAHHFIAPKWIAS